MQVTEKSRHLTASMVVIDTTTDQVLLVHHNATGKWVFPGGHVDADESPVEAAIREVFEETGVHAVAYDPAYNPMTCDLPGMSVLASSFITAEIPAPAKPDRPGKPAEPAHTHIDLLFIGIADSGTPMTTAPDEVAGARWVRLDELGGLDVRAEVPAVAVAAFHQLSSDRKR